MKFVIWIVLGAGLSGAGWLWSADGPPEKLLVQPAALSDARERAGLYRMLDGQEGLRFADLVIGLSDGDLRDFRGRLEREGRMRPVFGQARRLCLKGLEAADCWEIAHLEIDGRPAAGFGEVADEATPPEMTAEALPEIDATFEAPPEEVAPEIETADLPREEETAEPAPVAVVAVNAPQPTHRVARQMINTRAGPGTENPVVARLPLGTLLTLADRQNGWGQFVIADDGRTVWASLKIVEVLQ